MSWTAPRSAEADLAAAGQDDAGLLELGEGAGAGEGADGLLLAAEVAAAAGEVGAGGAELGVDVAGGDAEGGHAVGVEADADLAGDAADALSTWPTPATPWRSRRTVSSTNQERPSRVMAGAVTA